MPNRSARCADCGGLFAPPRPTGRPPKRCPSCVVGRKPKPRVVQPKPKPKPKVPLPRPCLACAEFFVPERLHRQVLCSKQCRVTWAYLARRFKESAEPTYRLNNLEVKRRQNFVRTGGEWTERVVEFQCANCRAHCVPGKNVAPHAKRFCSSLCRQRVMKQERNRRLKAQRVSARIRRAELARQRRSDKRSWEQRTCPTCSGRFIVRSDYSDRTCSAECSTTWKAERRREVMRRRKFRERGARRGERYSLRQVAERDRWRCGLCRGRVSKSKAAPHPKAPTIDHILPLSLGGDDTLANVQLACFLCNSLKGNRVLGPGEQLRLVG